MERKYFEINEETARRAKSMMSFDDYKMGSKTAEYKSYCDNVYDLAETAIQERPDAEERITRLAYKYAKRMADNLNKDSEIGMRYPSIMIAGGSNFNNRKKEKQIDAWSKNNNEFNEIQKIADRIKAIRYGKDIISSTDSEVIEKLKRKIEAKEQEQEYMKKVNRAVRLKDTEKGNQRLREMGISESGIKELRTPNIYGEIGYPRFVLTNNSANIRRLKGRLKQIESVKESGSEEERYDDIRLTVSRNADDMYIRLMFDEKPDRDVINAVKAAGFHWSRKNTAWQRKYTDNAKYATDHLINDLLG